MVEIVIAKRIFDNFGSGFDELFKVINEINALIVKGNIDICLDLSNCVFLNPFFLLPLRLLTEQYKNQANITFKYNDISQGFEQYLDLIYFEQNGLMPSQQHNLADYNNKTYLPIIRFPATRNNGQSQIRDEFLGVVTNQLMNQLNLKGKLLTSIMYLIDEMVNNIVDHAGVQEGFLFCQFYINKGFLDFCLVDNGVGLLGNYQTHNLLQNNNTHKDAIALAINGHSTKDRPEGSRGFGITTSKDMLVNGLKGKYLLFSGNSYYVQTVDSNQIVELPEFINWNGTLVALRIPTFVPQDFNPSNYY